MLETHAQCVKAHIPRRLNASTPVSAPIALAAVLLEHERGSLMSILDDAPDASWLQAPGPENRRLVYFNDFDNLSCKVNAFLASYDAAWNLQFCEENALKTYSEAAGGTWDKWLIIGLQLVSPEVLTLHYGRENRTNYKGTQVSPIGELWDHGFHGTTIANGMWRRVVKLGVRFHKP